MRILLLTPQRPYPPHQGTTLRNFNLVKELAKHHTVCVLSFLERDQKPEEVGPLPQLCAWLETVPVPTRTTGQRLRQMLTSQRPDMSWRLWSPLFEERLRQRLEREQFDVVQIEGIEMAPYLTTLEAIRPRPLTIYDAHNAEWILQRRAFATDIKNPLRWPAALYSSIQWRRLWRYEADLMQRANHTVAMSGADKAALHQINPQRPVTIVPNGVDFSEYAGFRGRPIPYDLVFTGKMDFRPNIDAVLWFGQQVLPLIQKQRPETTLAVVGQRPHPRLDLLRHLPGVTLTGYVDDVRPYIAGATVYVVPLRVGGGTRLKLMEAMAMGKAIVSTSLGAEGFPVAHGHELVLADEPEPFAREVLDLLRDPVRRAALGQKGQAFAGATYDWQILIPRLERIYQQVTL